MFSISQVFPLTADPPARRRRQTQLRRGRLLQLEWERLSEELDALHMSAADLARRFKVRTNRVAEILNGQRAITGDTALRLAHFFGTSAEFWINLQSLYELRLAEAKPGKAIKKLPTLKHLEEAHV